MELGECLKSLNVGKNNLMDDPDTGEIAEKDYKPYLINRCFSNFKDTAMYAQDMNIRSILDNRMQYEYFLHALRRRNRFSPWLKAEKPEDLDLVKEYFGYSNIRAKEALRILTEDQIEYIKKKLDKGGIRKK